MAHRTTHRRTAGRTRRRGFTLIETSLATVIVGVGVLAIVAAQQAFHQKNAWSTHLSTATWLGNEIREMTLNLPRHDPVTGIAFWGPEPDTELTIFDYDDLDDFDGPAGTGLVFSGIPVAGVVNGPRNSRREIIANMDGWVQTIFVDMVDPFNITAPPVDPDVYLMRVTVVVSYQGPLDDAPEDVATVAWIAPNS
jgi:prepilin-type N-terminal cleavage/methylation domain-containing protein